MLRASASGRMRLARTLPLVALLACLAVSTFPAAGAASLTVPGGATPTVAHSVVTTPSSTGVTAHKSGSASSSAIAAANHFAQTHSFAGGSAGPEFFRNNSQVSQIPISEQGCNSYNYGYEIENLCTNSPQAADTSIVTAANGDIGVGFTIATNVTGTNTAGCAPGPTTVQERVGFAVSSDNATTFSPVDFLGNETCSYLDSIEPSFAVAPSGTIYGTYVEENYSGPVGTYDDPGYATHCYYYCYFTAANRSADAIGFTWSTNNGTSFAAPVTINNTGWIAHPQIAVFGQSVYILFENINNNTSGVNVNYGYGFSGSYYQAPAIQLELLASSNGGATWKGPYQVPGITGISGVANELGPGIAVNKTGTVGISYFTNDSCAFNYFSSCEWVGDDLVLTTTITNGTSFIGPKIISGVWGSTPYFYLPYYDYGYGSNFEMQPQSSIAFDPTTGETVYIAFTAAYNQTALFGTFQQYYIPYEEDSGAFETTGSVTGAGFTTHVLHADTNFYPDDYTYSPVVAVDNEGIFVTYTGVNESYCYSYGGTVCPYDSNAYYQAVHTSSDGKTWSEAAYPTFSLMAGCVYCYSNDYPGYYNGITFASNGNPIYSYALPKTYQYTYNFATSPYYYNSSDPTWVYVATNYTGATVSLNISANGLQAGTPWSVTVNGYTINVPGGTKNVTLGGIAVNQTVFFQSSRINVVVGEIATPVVNIFGATSAYNGAAQFDANGTVEVNFSYEYAVFFNIQPSDPFLAEIESNPCCNYYYEIYSYTLPPQIYGNPALPWYFTQGTVVSFMTYGEPVAAQYWTGVGNGSYTGPGSEVNLTVNGVITETAWFLGVAQYNVTVNAVGLPSASSWSFTFDGTQYSGTGSASVNVPNVFTGSHSITKVSGSSSTAGYAYVGTASDYLPVLIPNSLTINLTFALVDVAAAAGTVSFEAQGFTAGTPWSFQFNGTTYSSNTPWINVTTRPGTFPTTAYPAVAANGSVGYLPNGVPSTWTVTTGSTYLVDFSQAYRVATVAGTGGTITGGGASGVLWALPGQSIDLSESPHTGYNFESWTGTGLGSYTGNSSSITVTANGPITETAGFYPLPGSRFNLTVQESGLAAGTLWTVNVGSVGYSGTGSTILIQNLLACGAPGATYNFSIPTVYASSYQTRYVPSTGEPKTICTTGTTLVHETFAPQYYVSVQSTGGGYATLSVGSVTVTTGLWVASGSTVSLNSYTTPGYDFLGWNGTGQGNYTGPLSSDTIVIGGPVLEVGAFALPVPIPTPTYTLTLTLATTLETGTVWSVQVNGGTYSSTGTSLVLSHIAAGSLSLVYPQFYSPDGLTKYTQQGNPTQVSLTANKSVTIAYQANFWFSATAGQGGTITAPSVTTGFFASGATVTITATPLAGYTFVSWSGTGNGAYSGTSSSANLPVKGPISEIASFAPIVQAKSTSSSSTPLLGQPVVWIGLGIVGLLVGLVVGVAVARRGSPPPPPAAEAPAPDSAPPETYGDEGGST